MIQIHHADAFEIIKDFHQQNLKVDAIITDPPYNISVKNNFSTLKSAKRQGIDFGEWDKNFKLLEWIARYAPLVNPNGCMVIFCSYRFISYIADFLEENGFVVKDFIQWVKTNPMPRNIHRRYVQDTEFALWAVKKKAKWVFNKPKNEKYLRPLILKSPVVSGLERVKHPTQKSLALMEKIISIHTNPPDGSVHVSCPLNLNDESLRLSLIKRLPWIKEQQQNFLNQNRQSQRGMLERESHYLFGKRYLLKIEHTIKKHFVLQSPKYLILHVHQKTSLENRLKVLENYYRQVLREKIQTYINQYEKILNESIQSFKIQKMKRIWGSCNIAKRTLLFNLELAKAPRKGIEYVVVHELLHLKARHHNEYFRDLLSLYLPNWQRAKASLKETYLEYS